MEHKGISSEAPCRFETLHESPRDLLQRLAHRRFAESGEPDSHIAMPRQLGIERNAAEARDPKGGGLGRIKERLDRVAVAAIVPTHVLDVTEDTIGSLR